MSQDIIYFQGLSRYFRHRSLFLTHYLIISSHFKIARLHSDSMSEFSSSDYSLIPSDVQLVIFFFFDLIVRHFELSRCLVPLTESFVIPSYRAPLFQLHFLSHHIYLFIWTWYLIIVNGYFDTVALCSLTSSLFGVILFICLFIYFFHLSHYYYCKILSLNWNLISCYFDLERHRFYLNTFVSRSYLVILAHYLIFSALTSLSRYVTSSQHFNSISRRFSLVG